MRKDINKFSIKGILFISLFVIIVFVLNSLYINHIEKDKIIVRKELEWQEYKKNLSDSSLDYAFFGDSHTVNGLNPEYIDNSFNFASSGEDYIETYYKIRKIIEKDNIKIKNFILEIDTHTFSSSIRTSQRLFEQLDYKNYMSLKDLSYLKQRSQLALLFDSEIKINGKGAEIINHIFSKPNPTFLRLGWTKNTGDFSKSNKSETALTTYNSYFKNEPILIEKKSFDYFYNILKLAKANDIGIIFIKYPMSYEYNVELERHNLSKENYYQDLFINIDEGLIDYVVLDYYDLFFEHPEYFSNSDHLNYIGSEILSRKVAEDLEIRKSEQ